MDAPIVKCLWIVIGVKRLINVDQSAAELHKNNNSNKWTNNENWYLLN